MKKLDNLKKYLKYNYPETYELLLSNEPIVDIEHLQQIIESIPNEELRKKLELL